MRLAPRIAVVFAVSVLAWTSSTRAAEERFGLVWMSGEEITQTFSGKPLAGLYPSERSWSEVIRSDGSTDYREGGNHWLGRWWIRDREFCFSYPPPGVGGWFRVTRISSNCFELYEFESPVGGDEAPPNIANLWNGRMWHADKSTTCENRPSV